LEGAEQYERAQAWPGELPNEAREHERIERPQGDLRELPEAPGAQRDEAQLPERPDDPAELQHEGPELEFALEGIDEQLFSKEVVELQEGVLVVVQEEGPVDALQRKSQHTKGALEQVLREQPESPATVIFL
jgi:hypothetical protein